jgi:hypothetical protein
LASTPFEVLARQESLRAERKSPAQLLAKRGLTPRGEGSRAGIARLKGRLRNNDTHEEQMAHEFGGNDGLHHSGGAQRRLRE